MRKTLDDAVKFPDPKTAQFFLSLLDDVRVETESKVNELRHRLSEVGIVSLYGDSFLHRGRVILFSGENYMEICPLGRELKQPYEGVPFTEITTHVNINEPQPQVFNGKYDHPHQDVVTAPLDTIVFLFAPRVSSKKGILPVNKGTVAKEIQDYNESPVPKYIRNYVDVVLSKVDVVGYRPAVDEDLSVAYSNILRHIGSRSR